MTIFDKIKDARAYIESVDRHMKEVDETCAKLRKLDGLKKSALRDKEAEKYAEYSKAFTEAEHRLEQLQSDTPKNPKKHVDALVRDLIEDFNKDAEEYNASFEKEYAIYCKARKDLAAAFMNLVKMQRDILLEKEEVATVHYLNSYGSGKKNDTYINCIDRYRPLPGMLPLKLLPRSPRVVVYAGRPACGESVTFLASGDIPEKSRWAIEQIVEKNQSRSDAYLEATEDPPAWC